MKPAAAIAYQGRPGAYSEQACRAACPEFTPMPCASFEDAVAAVRSGQAARAMIPTDNSLAGRVADVHRLLPEAGLFICGEHFLPIRHALLGVRGAELEKVRHVHSHVHALPQCRHFIEKHALTAHVASDTAGAAEDVARTGDPEHAAIASAAAAPLYGLDVLATDIQDNPNNVTRFVVLSAQERTPAYVPGHDYLTSLIFRVKNIPAALHSALSVFAAAKINLCKIESYMDERFQAAQFYGEIEAHRLARDVAEAFEKLETVVADMRILGTYEAAPFRARGETD